MSLSNLFCFGSQVFLVVDTTAPLPHSQNKSSRMNGNHENIHNPAQKLQNENYVKKAIVEEDSLGPVCIIKHLNIVFFFF